MERFLRILHVAGLVVLCLTGASASAILFQGHLYLGTGGAWLDAACGESDEGGVTDCDTVIHSRWGTILGMPTAFWGLIYFSVLALWFLFIGQPSSERWYWHVLPVAGILTGVAVSVFFMTIMLTELKHRCTWCIVAHVANVLILILTLLLWPRRPARAGDRPPDALPETHRPPGRPHPSARLVLAVMSLALLTVLCIGLSAALSTAAASTETLKAIAQVMYQLYQDEAVLKISLRADDPQKTAGDAQLHVRTVVFGDFACPHCRWLAEALESEFNPLFDDHLQIIFKHYPFCSDCNPHVQTRAGTPSCQAARAAEAARMQGGNEAFWGAHDLLFERAKRKLLGAVDYRKFARDLNLDPDRFVAEMESEEATRRIREDAELGWRLGVRRTPAVFVQGRRVPDLAVMKLQFWRAVAHVYKAKIAQQNNEATQSAFRPRKDPPPSRPPAAIDGSRESLSEQATPADPGPTQG